MNTRSRSPFARHLILTLASALLPLLAAAQTSWTGASSSNWLTAGNWSAGVPTSGTSNTTINSANPVTLAGAANSGGNFDFINGSLTLNTGAALGSTFANVGFNGSTTGTASAILNAGSWTVSNNFALRTTSGHTATLTLRNGASLSANGIYIANVAGTTGTLEVGGGTSFTGSLGAASEFSIGAGGTLVFSQTGSYTFSSVISASNVDSNSRGTVAQAGPGGTTLSGAGSVLGTVAVSGGTLNLTGANTQTGATTITAGQVSVNAANVSLGTVTIGNGTTPDATLRAISNASSTAASVYLHSNSTQYATLNLQNGHTMTVTGATVLAGNTDYTYLNFGDSTSNTTSGGTFNANGGLALSGPYASLGFYQTGNALVAGNISGNGVINVGTTNNTASGAALLYGNNAGYTGQANLVRGTLQLGGDFNGNILFASGSGAKNVVFDGASTFAGTITNSGSNTGTSGVYKVATGTLILTGNNDSPVSLNVQAGSVQFGNGGTTGYYGGPATLATGTSLIFNRSDTYTHFASISGAGAVVQAGTGTTVLNELGANTATYTGGTTVNSGTLQFATRQSLPAAGTLTVAAGATATFNVHSTDSTYFGAAQIATRLAAGDGATTGFLPGARLGIDTTNAGDSFTLAGLANPGGRALNLIKSGSGTLELNGTSTYTGITTVAAGRLLVNGLLEDSTTVFVAAGATLGGDGTINGHTTLASGAHLAPGTSTGTITFANDLTLNAGSVLDFQLGTTSDLIRAPGGTLNGPASGTVTVNLTDAGGFAPNTYELFDLNAATLNDFSASDFVLGTSISGYNYSFVLTSGSLDLVVTSSAIPEPSTCAALAGLGALGLVAWRRHRTTLVRAA